MPNYVIIPDTSCDLIKPLRERFGIDDYISGLVYFPDGHVEKSDLDWERYNPIEFYQSMSDKKTIYKTACAPAGDIMEVFERQLQAGNDIICVTLSSALSGTFQACEMVKQELLQKYPQRKIVCIDSLRYSTALSLLIILAAQKRQEGYTFEETVAYIEETKHCVHQMGPMDDLFFLVRTGRISNFKAFFGTLVGINPMADFNRQGLSEVIAKFKGKKAAFDAIVKYMKETVVDPENQIMFVAHSNRQAAAEMLRDRLMEEFHPKEIIINHIGMSCGASIGPGLCAAFYLGREISDGMEREKSIMKDIISSQGK